MTDTTFNDQSVKEFLASARTVGFIAREEEEFDKPVVFCAIFLTSVICNYY